MTTDQALGIGRSSEAWVMDEQAVGMHWVMIQGGMGPDDTVFVFGGKQML